MKLFASILLTLSFAALAAAQTFLAFSVSNVVRTKDNVYTAEKNTVDTHGEKSAGDYAYHFITFKTEGCTHVPGKGATAIFLGFPNGNAELQFSDGGTCKVDVTESDNYKIGSDGKMIIAPESLRH